MIQSQQSLTPSQARILHPMNETPTLPQFLLALSSSTPALLLIAVLNRRSLPLMTALCLVLSAYPLGYAWGLLRRRHAAKRHLYVTRLHDNTGRHFHTALHVAPYLPLLFLDPNRAHVAVMGCYVLYTLALAALSASNCSYGINLPSATLGLIPFQARLLNGRTVQLYVTTTLYDRLQPSSNSTLTFQALEITTGVYLTADARNQPKGLP